MNHRGEKKKKRRGGCGDCSSGQQGRAEMKYLDRLTEELAGSVLAVIWFHRRKQRLIQLAVWSSSLVLTSQLRIHFTPHWQRGLTDLSGYHWILGWGEKSAGEEKSGSFSVRGPLSLSLSSPSSTRTLSLSPLSLISGCSRCYCWLQSSEELLQIRGVLHYSPPY